MEKFEILQSFHKDLTYLILYPDNLCVVIMHGQGIRNWADRLNGRTKVDEDEMLDGSKGCSACWSRTLRGHNFAVGLT
jgi:hypothetical protein